MPQDDRDVNPFSYVDDESVPGKPTFSSQVYVLCTDKGGKAGKGNVLYL